MIQSFTKIVSLIILLVGITASQTTAFAETESNSLCEYISLADANSDTDDSESLQSSILATVSARVHAHQNSTVQIITYLVINTAFSIRAPPYLYL